jgi:hypothetical protein
MPENDPFVKKVTGELREMDRREEKLRGDAERIRQQLVLIRQRRVELDRSLATYRDVMGVGGEPGASTEPPEGTIADVALRVLEENGSPMTVGSLVAELSSLGKLKGGGTSGRADYGTVYQAIGRDSRFIKVGKGQFSPAAHPNEQPQPAEQSATALPD